MLIMQNNCVCKKIFENLLINNNSCSLWFIYLYFEIKTFFSKNTKRIKKRCFYWIFSQKKINVYLYLVSSFNNLKKAFNFNIFLSNYIEILFIKNSKHNTCVSNLVNFLPDVSNFVHLKWKLLNYFIFELKFGNIKNLIIYFGFLSLNYFFNSLCLLTNKIYKKKLQKKIIFAKKYIFFLNQSKDTMCQIEIIQYVNNLSKFNQFLKRFILIQLLMVKRFTPWIFGCVQKKMSTYQNIFFTYYIYFKIIFYFRKIKKNLLLIFLSVFF